MFCLRFLKAHKRYHTATEQRKRMRSNKYIILRVSRDTCMCSTGLLERKRKSYDVDI